MAKHTEITQSVCGTGASKHALFAALISIFCSAPFTMTEASVEKLSAPMVDSPLEDSTSLSYHQYRTHV
jgi:hypothetical protein